MTTLSKKEVDVIFACVHNAHAEFGSDRKSVAILAAHKAAKKELGVDSLNIHAFMQAWKVMTHKKERSTPVKLLVTCPACGEWNTFDPNAFRMSGHLSAANPCANPFCTAWLETEDPFEVTVVPKEEIETWDD